MNSQRELDRVLQDFFVEGTDELADRVIDAALNQIDHTQQRRPIWVPRRIKTMTFSSRLATAAVIGVLAIGGGLMLLNAQSQVGTPRPTATSLESPSATAVAVLDYANLPGWIVFERNIHSPVPSSGETNRGDLQLWAVHADGSGLHELAPGKPADSGKLSPDFSPDGRTVAFSSVEPAKAFEYVSRIRQEPIDGGDPVLVSIPCDFRADQCDFYDPAYAPDGKRMAFVEIESATSQMPLAMISVLDLATGKVTRLDSTRTTIGRPTQPTWSPDGSQIAYGYVTGSVTVPRRSRVMIVNADGTAFHELPTPGVLIAGDPDWAPDGSSIVFSTRTVNTPGTALGLYTVRPDGTGLTDLCAGRKVCGMEPTWTPDGRHILYQNVGDGWNLMDPDGSNRAPINKPALGTLSVDGEAVILQPTP